MADNDRRPLIAPQKPLQPHRRLQVQMVRRLIEQQKIRRLHQRPGKAEAAELTAAKRRYPGLMQLLANTQTRQNTLDPRLVNIPADKLEFPAQTVVFLHPRLKLPATKAAETVP